MYKFKNITKSESLFIVDKLGNNFILKPGEEKLNISLPRDGFDGKLSIEETKDKEDKKIGGKKNGNAGSMD